MRALSEVLGAKLEYDDTAAMRDRMWDVSPTLAKYDVVEKPSAVLVGIKALHDEAARAAKEARTGGLTGAFKKPIQNFYKTDPISRNSVTMTKCTVRPASVPHYGWRNTDPAARALQKAFVEEWYPASDREQSLPLASHA